MDGPYTVRGPSGDHSSAWSSLVQGKVYYGAPGNWYGTLVSHWSDNHVVFMVPDGEPVHGPASPALLPGCAAVRIVSADGLATAFHRSLVQ